MGRRKRSFMPMKSEKMEEKEMPAMKKKIPAKLYMAGGKKKKKNK